MAHTQTKAASLWLYGRFPYVVEQDAAEIPTLVVPSLQYTKRASGLFLPVSPDDPMPVDGTVNVGNLPETQQISGSVSVSNGNVGITGRNLTAAPVHGAKTVTTTAASLFAGVSRLAGRNYLAVYNESSNTIYVGGSGVTTANGFPILPGEYRVFSIDPASDFGIYAVASANSAVRVEEGK